MIGNLSIFFSLRRALRKLIERLLVESKLRGLKSDYYLTAGGKTHKKRPHKNQARKRLGD